MFSVPQSLLSFGTTLNFVDILKNGPDSNKGSGWNDGVPQTLQTQFSHLSLSTGQRRKKRTPKNKNMDGYIEGNVCIEFARVRKEEKLSKAKTNCLSWHLLTNGLASWWQTAEGGCPSMFDQLHHVRGVFVGSGSSGPSVCQQHSCQHPPSVPF